MVHHFVGKQRTTKSRKSRNGKRRVATKKKKKCRFGEFVFFYFGCFKSYTDSKPIYRLKSIKTAETTRYTPVSRAVQIRSVFVPVQVLTWKILAVPNSMERNCLPWCVEFKIRLNYGFQLAQLVKILLVELIIQPDFNLHTKVDNFIPYHLVRPEFFMSAPGLVQKQTWSVPL